MRIILNLSSLRNHHTPLLCTVQWSNPINPFVKISQKHLTLVPWLFERRSLLKLSWPSLKRKNTSILTWQKGMEIPQLLRSIFSFGFSKLVSFSILTVLLLYLDLIYANSWGNILNSFTILLLFSSRGLEHFLPTNSFLLVVAFSQHFTMNCISSDQVFLLSTTFDFMFP